MADRALEMLVVANSSQRKKNADDDVEIAQLSPFASDDALKLSRSVTRPPPRSRPHWCCRAHASVAKTQYLTQLVAILIADDQLSWVVGASAFGAVGSLLHGSDFVRRCFCVDVNTRTDFCGPLTCKSSSNETWEFPAENFLQQQCSSQGSVRIFH